MAQTKSISDLINIIRGLIQEKSLTKLTLSKKQDKKSELKNIFIKPVLIKGIEQYNTVYRYETKDITKNTDIAGLLDIIKNALGDKGSFKHCDIFSTLQHIQAIVSKDFQTVTLITHLTKQSDNAAASLNHNITKSRLINTDRDISRVYLRELGLLGSDGQIIASMQHKYKQINKYVEILKPYLDKLAPKSKSGLIYDMGSGKGYLSFALADYSLQNNTNSITIKGIEMRQDMVDNCSSIVSLSKLTNLSFEKGNISDYFTKDILLDGIVALHACDTATDEAIFMGIKNQASLIVAAPCCHRQIRKNILENKSNPDYPFLKHITKHGIILERQAEYVTDTIRALLLEISGYKVKVVEFVNLENTPKNTLIIATKRLPNEIKTKEIEQLKIDLIGIKKHFGITEHYLEGLLSMT
jgi:Methyltransferase domain